MWERGVQCVHGVEITREQEGRWVPDLSLGTTWEWQSNGRWRMVVMLVFVLYVLMKNVFYEAWGSRLFGSRKLWHKVSLLLDNLMWCVASLSSQVLFSRLRSFCFGLFGKSVFAVLCVCDRERMLHEVSHRIRYCCSDPPKFCRGSRTSLSLLEEISGSPNTCSKGHTLDNLVEFNALAMLCYHRSEDPCPCCCHQQGICFCLGWLNFIGLSLATFSDTAMLWNL